MKHRFLFITFLSLLSLGGLSQQLTQTVRGNIIDKVSNEPMVGAVIIVNGIDPVIGSVADIDGNFKLLNVPVGRQNISITMLGYKTITMTNVLVNSGKELVLNIPMDEELNVTQEVTVTADKNKKEPLNNMAGVSARTFSVEETQKFAASVNDPSRMATSFAGVVSGGDFNNKISIRGNSPYGLLWRMEGADIPNPNHFANPATSGGGISILSAQTLSNSDFITGAFPADYGNALAGVFDLRLRKGNNEKHEYTIQAGFMGLDVAAEGPFKKGYGGSYLVNYRYSTLSFLKRIGVPIGDGVTNFQDVSFNFYMPTKKAGSFEVYGFGGLSDEVDKAQRDTSKWEYDYQRYDSRFHSNTGAAGLKHLISLGSNSYLQTNVVMSATDIGYVQEKLSPEMAATRDYEETDYRGRALISTVFNHKFNAKHSMRAGAYYNQYGFKVYKEFLNNDLGKFETQLDATGNATTLQAFAQWKYRVDEQLTVNTGVHVLSMPSNHSTSVEPRFSARYQLDDVQTVSVGYGLHSQMQPVGIYEAQVLQADGTYKKPNEDLGFNKAHHLVLGYERSLTKYMYVKTELYYQHLYNIAVGADSASTLSTLNVVENYLTEQMINAGKGRNYGLELTLEQFTHNDMYFLLSGSLYNSEYMAQDKVWRNTRFNANYAFSFTAGKEMKVGKSEKDRTLGINIRTIYTGGFRETPLDLNGSIAKGEAVYQEDKAFEGRIHDYLRLDVRVSIRRNRAHSTSTLALDLLNATNHKNVYGSYFEAQSGTVKTDYQMPLLPVLSYRVEF